VISSINALLPLCPGRRRAFFYFPPKSVRPIFFQGSSVRFLSSHPAHFLLDFFFYNINHCGEVIAFDLSDPYLPVPIDSPRNRPPVSPLNINYPPVTLICRGVDVYSEDKRVFDRFRFSLSVLSLDFLVPETVSFGCGRMMAFLVERTSSPFLAQVLAPLCFVFFQHFCLFPSQRRT